MKPLFSKKVIFMILVVAFILIILSKLNQQYPYYKPQLNLIPVLGNPTKEVEKEYAHTDKEETFIENKENKTEKVVGASESVISDNVHKLKYILLWTAQKTVPFVYMGNGQEVFREKGCKYSNCFVTANRSLLGDYTKFDLIAFAGPQLLRLSKNELPNRRSPHQKYVFASIESSDNYPVCSNRFDEFFNWTWTFRLDSEAKWGYMVIKDKDNNVIGPRKDMNWIKFEDMDPVSEKFKDKLKSKFKAAAWFVSNCFSRSKREVFVSDLQKELINNYNLTVDIYGPCGPLQCSRDNEKVCFDMLRDEYYFYLSFENSFSDDYVTEKLRNAVEHDTVPIVYGGADYTRFMPNGAYLNARELGVKDLAAKMDYLIKYPDEYAEYFRWKKYYSYHRQSEDVNTDEYCGFCTILNNEEKVKQTSVYHNFREWWDPPGRC